MKRFVIAIGLTYVLCGSAFAGEMPIGGFAPPPDGTVETTSATPPGDMQCDGVATTPGESRGPGQASTSASEAALNLLQTLLSVI